MKNPFAQKKIKPGSVALVGNGTSLLGKGYGIEIDDHDVVVRMNAAPTAEYEEDVGSRTDWRVLNDILIHGWSLSVYQTPKDWIKTLHNSGLILRKTTDKKQQQVLGILEDRENKVLTVTSEFHETITTVRNRIGVPKISTGLFSLLLFINVTRSIDLYGYDFYQSNGHYWEKATADPTSNHDFSKEHIFIHKLCRTYGFELHN
jgi:hypothetical protein